MEIHYEHNLVNFEAELTAKCHSHMTPGSEKIGIYAKKRARLGHYTVQDELLKERWGNNVDICTQL